MMLTSSGEPQDATQCAALGISACLVKPVRQTALCEAILTALGRTAQSGVARPDPARAVALRILLAEDNVVNQRVALGLLEHAGHKVEVASNGIEAVAAHRAGQFDLILMDMQMPELGGAEAIQLIRRAETESGGRTAIVAVTAHALKGDRERCLEAGADGYVSKPINPTVFFHEIERVLEQSSGSRPLGKPVRDASLAAGLLARVGGSPKVLQEVIGLFLEDCPRLIDVIQQALDNKDAQAVYRAAHTLKGSAANFDAQDTVAIAQRLEARAREGDVAACVKIFAALRSEVNVLLNTLANEVAECAS
jgi:CheY-like chemotaxis protein